MLPKRIDLRLTKSNQGKKKNSLIFLPCTIWEFLTSCPIRAKENLRDFLPPIRPKKQKLRSYPSSSSGDLLPLPNTNPPTPCTHTHTMYTFSKSSPIHVLRHARNSDILVLKCNDWCNEEPTSKRKKTHKPAALGLRLESHNGKTKLRKKHYKTKPKKKKWGKSRKKNLRNSIEIERTKLKRHSSIPPYSLSPSFLLLLPFPLPLLLFSSFGELPNASYHTSKTQALIGQVGHETKHTGPPDWCDFIYTYI